MRCAFAALLGIGLLASGVAAAYDLPRQDFGQRFYERQAERSAAIQEREQRIGYRIQRAVDEGRLRPWEARRLYGELGYVRQKEHAFRADGRIDGREFAELNGDLDRLAERVRYEAWHSDRREYAPHRHGYDY